MEANRRDRELDEQIAETTNTMLQGGIPRLDGLSETKALEPVIAGLAGWFSESPSAAFTQRLSARLDEEWENRSSAAAAAPAPVQPGSLKPDRVRPALTVTPRRRNWTLPAIAAVLVVVIVSALLVPRDEGIGLLSGSAGVGGLPIEGVVVVVGLALGGVYAYWRSRK